MEEKKKERIDEKKRKETHLRDRPMTFDEKLTVDWSARRWGDGIAPKKRGIIRFSKAKHSRRGGGILPRPIAIATRLIVAELLPLSTSPIIFYCRPLRIAKRVFPVNINITSTGLERGNREKF